MKRHLLCLSGLSLLLAGCHTPQSPAAPTASTIMPDAAGQPIDEAEIVPEYEVFTDDSAHPECFNFLPQWGLLDEAGRLRDKPPLSHRLIIPLNDFIHTSNPDEQKLFSHYYLASADPIVVPSAALQRKNSHCISRPNLVHLPKLGVIAADGSWLLPPFLDISKYPPIAESKQLLLSQLRDK